MEKIEKYIDTLCKNLYAEPDEIDQIKEEIRVHFFELIKELQLEGMTKDEAVDAAIQKFGEEKQINLELRKVYHFQAKFKKTIMIAAFGFLFAAILLFVFHGISSYQNTSDFDGLQRDYHKQIEDKIMAGEELSSDDLEKLFLKYERILRLITISKSEPGSPETTETRFPSEVPKDEITIQPYMTYSLTASDHSEWEVRFALQSDTLFSSLPHYLFVLSMICFAMYWLLFGIWNIVNAYHMNRLNLLWTISFFTLNLIAYFLFELGRKLEMKKINAI